MPMNGPDFQINFNIEDQQGVTPFQYACTYGQVKVVVFFLVNLINLRIKDPVNWTDGKIYQNLCNGIEMATDNGNEQIVEILTLWTQKYQ